MWRYLVGVVAGVLLVAGGALWWRSTAVANHALPEPAGAAYTADAAGQADEAMPEPPRASAKTREEKRLSRIDHDKNGQVSRDEFLAARRRNYDKLDTNHDGRLSFEEYAVKGVERFAGADKDRSGALTAAEFATTRVVRKERPRCAPARGSREGEEES